ncbi:MAG: 16S rRNA processing protein RimM [Clostridia bacterium]|nr:16S rRNA processing protein RimM [Clostridia bacterium]MBO7288848.1 16S rRNA processing protein RimM [Clostridia bacterium]
MSKKLIDVAEVTNTHGLRGEVKILPRTDYPEFFEEISGVYLEEGTYLKITGIKYQKNMVILKFKGINKVEEAETLRRKILYVPKEIFDDLPEGTYLIADIIGLEVFEDDISYGKITDVFSTGSNDVYAVEKPNEKPLLIPALKNVIEDINIDEGYMKVRLPEGLLD